MPSPAPVHFRVELANLHAHLFRVTLTVAQPAASQRVSLPVWIPGSYLVREFARNLQQLKARQGTRRIEALQLDKCTWQIQCAVNKPLVLTYEVYALDNSVRTAWLDPSRGFFNNTSLCLRVEGQEHGQHELDIMPSPSQPDWMLATGLTAKKVSRHLCGCRLRRVDRLPGGNGHVLERLICCPGCSPPVRGVGRVTFF